MLGSNITEASFCALPLQLKLKAVKLIASMEMEQIYVNRWCKLQSNIVFMYY